MYAVPNLNTCEEKNWRGQKVVCCWNGTAVRGKKDWVWTENDQLSDAGEYTAVVQKSVKFKFFGFHECNYCMYRLPLVVWHRVYL